MNVKQKLAKLLNEYGRGAKTRLAEHLGVPSNYVTRWSDENYGERFPPEYYVPTSEFFGVENTYFLDGVAVGSPVRAVRIVGEASCGLPIGSSYQSIDDFTHIPAELFKPQLYALIANGDSMHPEINDGDKVICDPTADIKSGDMVHYILDGDSAIKIYYDNIELNAIELIPYNQNNGFKTLSFRKDDERLENMQRRKVVLVVRDNLDSPKARLRRINKE